VGHAVTHSDIGGYTVETDLGDDMYYVRTPELLQRWSEMGAFGFGELPCFCSLVTAAQVLAFVWALEPRSAKLL
jgi:hypothetical protein